MDEVDGEALEWALRMAEPDADWDAFTCWLEEDPSRAARYDAAAVALDHVTQAVGQHTRSEQVVANDPGPVGVTPARATGSRRAWFGGAIAAAVMAAVGLGSWYQREEIYTVGTPPGEQRMIALADGSRIVLAGGSRVQLDRTDPRTAKVEAGEMVFLVRHDEKTPFRVSVDGLQLVDLGTVFNVRMTGPRTRVAVAEGAVMVDRGGATVRLDPGQAVVFDGEVLRREREDVTEIGGWRRGLLTFNDATMGEVADELSRKLGWRITATPAVQRQSFNGTLQVAALQKDPTLLGDLLDVQVRRNGDVWTLDQRR